MTVGVNVGVKCCCGRMDCVETIASGSGFDACARLLKDRYDTRLEIPSDEGVVVDVVMSSGFVEGDELCRVLVENATQGIANLIMNLVDHRSGYRCLGRQHRGGRIHIREYS